MQCWGETTRLNDKVALITGASRGIGRGIALKFAEEGADVVVNYRENIELAETLSDKIRSLGGKTADNGFVMNDMRSNVSKFFSVDCQTMSSRGDIHVFGSPLFERFAKEKSPEPDMKTSGE
jgi:NAD(P)-dependent dehydrogenase (short-subunit alcohol dehydrogenase family)